MSAQSVRLKTENRKIRDGADWYQEPAWCVDALLDAERFRGTTWDPACGEGTIPKRCSERGLHAFGTDLHDRGFGAGGVDFLTAPVTRPVSNIITNPPYALAEAFVNRALEIADHKVAVLVRLAFLEGQARRKSLESWPMSRVLVSSRRISMPPAGQGIKASGGTVAFCWLVFDHDHKGPATVGWF